MKNEHEESQYLHKTSCDSCGSSDANAVYANGNKHCFSCNKTVFNKDGESKEVEYDRSLAQGLVEMNYKPLVARGITLETARKFNYGYTMDGKKHIATYYKDGRVVAQKFRTKDKDFSWIGDTKKPSLFGSQVWTPNPKMKIVITEGELDAMALSQAQDNKYPVVSVPNGASAAKKDIGNNLEYLMGFQKVVLCFDQDEPGRKAAQEVATLFPPNKVFIATLPLKDANEMLLAGKSAELIQCIWNAKAYKPEGILSGEDIINRMTSKKTDRSYPFPDFMKATNLKTRGIRIGELDIFTSGSGMGKSSLVKQLQVHLYDTTDLNQGLIHLEEPLEFTANTLAGMALKVRPHLDDSVSPEVLLGKAKEIFMAVDAEDFSRFNLLDSFGSVEAEELYNKIRFMVKGLGCKVIWLDHLSILVSSLSQDSDERRTIDQLMHNLKSLTQELDCYIGLIVHLNNQTTGKTFEEGGVPNLNNLRGSGSLKQLSDTVYALSRNQQADSEDERNTSLITVLKCRYSGETGPSDYIFFNNKTGCFEAGYKPDTQSKVNSQTNEFD